MQFSFCEKQLKTIVEKEYPLLNYNFFSLQFFKGLQRRKGRVENIPAIHPIQLGNNLLVRHFVNLKFLSLSQSECSANQIQAVRSDSHFFITAYLLPLLQKAK